MARRRPSHIDIEPLEVRLMLTGNVSVGIGEVLQLRGDAAGNEVSITQNRDGVLTVTGLDGTTVNGRTSIRRVVDIEKVDVKLSGGPDRLVTKGLRASVDINIEMGAGNDRVNLRNTVAGVNMSVKTADGLDRVAASGVRTGSDFYIETGEGPSVVSVAGSRVGKTLTVIGGDRADQVTIRGTTTREDLNVESKKGDDRTVLTNVRSNKNIKVDSDVGRDYVSLEDVYAASDAVFLGGDGFDTLRNRGVRAGEKLEIKGFEQRV